MTFEEQHRAWCGLCRFDGLPGRDNGALIADICPDLVEEER